MIVGYLMGLRNVIPVPEENVTAEIPNPNDGQAKTFLTEEERAALNATLRDDLWFYDQALKHMSIASPTGGWPRSSPGPLRSSPAVVTFATNL